VCTFPRCDHFFNVSSLRSSSTLDLLQGVIGLWHVGVLRARRLCLSLFLVITQHSRRPVKEGEHRGLRPIRRPDTALTRFFFGLYLDLARPAKANIHGQFILDLDLSPEFKKIARRQIEQVGYPPRVAEHEGEQWQSPSHDAPARIGPNDLVARSEVNRFV
jgi:hypothetical protein